MISDLNISSNIFATWKYVDDTTISEIIPRGKSSEAQSAVDAVSSWSRDNLFQLSTDKCKEIRISFRKPREEQSWTDINIDNALIRQSRENQVIRGHN